MGTEFIFCLPIYPGTDRRSVPYQDTSMPRWSKFLNAAWGINYFGTTRTLDQHIAQLRKKLEIDTSNPKIILTVHGVGYRLGVVNA